MTPTYTGCPAIDSIASDITAAFRNANLNILVNLVLHPAWTTDDITPEGRRKLKEYGIAAPLDEVSNSKILLMGERILPCPVCYSTNTTLISQFGTTACKALFKCDDCQEPFDYFKCHK
jgi:ring-1,2-phenylacetyl-CoA epoxidase subunit PaaD